MAKEKMPTTADTEVTAPETEEVVVFAAQPGIRVISEEDWKAAGVEHAGLRWDAYNNWTVPRSELNLSDSDFNRFILADRDFRVEQRPIETTQEQ